jgi:hypothetical protein
VPLDELQRLGGVEGLLEHDTATHDHRGQEDGAEPEDVEERNGAEDCVLRVEPQRPRRRDRRREQARVREHDPLRLPRRPRRVQDRPHVFLRVDPGLRQLLPLAAGDEVLELEDAVVVPQLLFADRHDVLERGKRLQKRLAKLEVVHPPVPLGDDAHGRFRVAEHELQLVQREPRVEGHQDGAQLGGGEGAEDELRPVREHDGDAIPRIHPEIAPRGRERPRPLPHLAVRERRVAKDDERPSGVRIANGMERVAERQVAKG